ncbi:MAG TPA: general secretion pathway protein GspH [Cellvibrio sp.]|uniref:prepilin-type N-terminal cleavage/methylation domain-containing protein n=1 Tax=Cellvibrio sp. TaxID=1965322 RepID=UPI000ECB940C|nr:prepilin-type N-terminal cleavage/methylation domain-containing protein [Cellvibrio sp.]HCS64853.1 general secretion pathway protein GspH [Cellvibrio sp.]
MKSSQQGFTLIEIIFVVFIIGMAVSVISIAVGGNAAADMTRKEAEEFMLQAGYIAEQSVLKGETHGLFVEPRPAQDIDGQEQWCYQWRRVRDRQWQDLPELGPHCLAEGQKIDFVVEDELWEFDPELEYQDPVMGFFPSGDGSGEIEITIYADQLPGGETAETEQFELDLAGELHWVSEEKRVEEEQRGR